MSHSVLQIEAHHPERAGSTSYECVLPGWSFEYLHDFIQNVLDQNDALKQKDLIVTYRGRDITYIPASAVPSYYGFREVVVVKERAREYSFWDVVVQYLFTR